MTNAPPAPRAKQRAQGHQPLVRVQRLYIALGDRWREEGALGSAPFEGERKAATIALRDGDEKTLTRLGHAAAARIAWSKLAQEYAEHERGIAKRFQLETNTDVRAMYGQPPLDVRSYAAAYNLVLRLIRERIDNDLYADYLEVRYMAAAYDWLTAGLWEMWRDEGYTAADEMQRDLAALPLYKLFLLYCEVERRVHAST